MSNEFIKGQRYPIAAKDAQGLINLSGSPLTAILIGDIDCSRGRRFVGNPGEWELWNTKGYKIKASISRDGVIISAEKEPDPDRPEPLGEQQ